MKLNKSILGLGGIMALTLTACHDDPVYEPAPQPVTPPAYFNMSDEQVVDLEEDSKDFIVPLYRANGGAAQTVNVTTTVTAEDGVNANVFDIPQTVTFEEGMTRADMVIKLDMADIVPLKEYDFTFKVDGESNPYLITDVAYTVMYTPWETVVDPANPDQSSVLKQDGWLTRPFEMNVLVQEQPSKPGFFRVRHPYYGMPEIEGGEQLYPESDPLWLYINATNARAAFFSDSRGKTPETFYRTGYKIDVYGEMVLVCVYSNYLNQKPLQIPGDDGAYAYDQFASYAGTFDNGIINWGGNMLFYADPSLIGAYQMDDWKIQLASAAPPVEWESMGTAIVQDGFLTNYFWEKIEGYTVAVERHIEKPGKIRLVNLWAMGTFPGGTITPTSPVYTEFDCTNPDCVLMAIQDMGYETPDSHERLRACNMGAIYYYGYTADKNGQVIQWTQDQIISEGLNDTFKNNVITINNPVIVDPKDNIYDLAHDEEAGSDWTFMPEIITINPTESPMVMKQEVKPVMNSVRVKLNPNPAPFMMQGKFKFGHLNR